MVYYKNISGNELYADGKKVSEGLELESNIVILRPMYYFDIMQKRATIQALVTFGDRKMSGSDLGNQEYKSSGIGDTTLIGGIWYIDNPEKQLWMGNAFYLTLPTGKYDHKEISNLGENRYKFKAELGFEKGFGDIQAGISSSIDIFTENDEYGAAKSKYEQEPVLNVELHLSHLYNKKILTALDYYYKIGGETEINGNKMDNKISTHTMQIELGYFILPNSVIFAHYQKDISVKNGLKLDIITLRAAYFIK